MSVTDTKEFIRMEIAADKLGVDQVKLVRMVQDKKMMVRLELPADNFEKIKWEIHGKKMIENEPDEYLIGDLIVITLEGMEVLERHLSEGKKGIDLLDGLELCVETNKDVLGSIVSRELGLPPPEIPPNSENIIRAYSLPETLMKKIKEKRITQPRLVIQTHDFRQLLEPQKENPPAKPFKSKPHLAFIAHQKNIGVKKDKAWNELKNLASNSKGEQQLELPGFGLIYLKRNKSNVNYSVKYSFVKFESPDDGSEIKKNTFDRAFDREK